MKKTISLILALVIMAVLPLTANAVAVTADYTLFLYSDGKLYTDHWSGEDVTAAMAAAGAVVTGSSGAWVLTLTDFSFETASEWGLNVPGNTTIVLNGANTIESTYNGTKNPAGIISSGALTINGSGSLDVVTSNASATISYGIHAVVGSITINGGTVTAVGATRAMLPSYTVPNGYKYWVNTAMQAPGGEGSVSDGSFVVDITYKYAKIEVPVLTDPEPDPDPDPDPDPKKYIFSTKYEATTINWILFFVCFGWIWMWF